MYLFPGNHFVFIFSASLLKLKTWMVHCLRNWVNLLSEMYLLMSFMILFFLPYLHSQLWMNFHAMHHFFKSLHTRRNKNGKWDLLRENSFLKSPADAVGEQPSVCSAQQISLTLHRVAKERNIFLVVKTMKAFWTWIYPFIASGYRVDVGVIQFKSLITSLCLKWFLLL